MSHTLDLYEYLHSHSTCTRIASAIADRPCVSALLLAFLFPVSGGLGQFGVFGDGRTFWAGRTAADTLIPNKQAPPPCFRSLVTLLAAAAVCLQLILRPFGEMCMGCSFRKARPTTRSACRCHVRCNMKKAGEMYRNMRNSGAFILSVDTLSQILPHPEPVFLFLIAAEVL